MIHRSKVAAFSLLAGLVAPILHAASVEESVYIAPKADTDAVAEQWRSVWRDTSPDVSSVRMQWLSDERIEAVKRHNTEPGIKALQVGIGREIASEGDVDAKTTPPLRWEPVAGGQVTRVEVTSPTAAGLRVGLRAVQLPLGSELRIAGSALPDLVYLINGDDLGTRIDAEGMFWTDVTDGETQAMELYVPGKLNHESPPTLRIEAVSHLLIAAHTDTTMAKALGASGSCQIDVVCRVNTLGSRFVNAKNAVARYLVQNGASTYSCSGTLLNDADPDTYTPWFITAQHCVGNQSHANTVTTFWNFETPSCGVDNPGPNRQIGGGAELKYASASRDAALMRLYRSPPDSAIFAGWDANTLAVNSNVTAIHHPAGDIKKVSQGRHTGVTANVTIGGDPRVNMLRVTWSEASTEGGSSGSGLFTLTETSYRLRGTLSGGAASCSNAGQPEAQGNRDYYSALSEIFPAIRQYIYTAEAAVGPTRDYSGAWYLPSEDGRGLSLYQYPNNTLFGLWFVYDSLGRASWYQLDPRWTGVDTASGRVVRWSGPAWGPNYVGSRSYVEVGNFTLRFTSASQGTLTYNVDGVSRTISLSKI